MKELFSPKKLVLLISLGLFLFSTTSSLAYFDKRGILGEATSSASKREENKARKAQRLSEVKLKICEKRQATIKKRSTKLAQRAQIMMTRFSAHAQRVEDYYTDKLVPKGVVVGNYDQLLTNISDKRALVEEAVENAVNAADDFDCSGDDPKGQLTSFRLDMQEAITALNNYKKTIRDLIVAVRTASSENSASSSAQ